MKILFANKFFHFNGGSERVFFQERDFFIDKGHKVIDFSMTDSRNISSPFSEFFVPNIDFNSSGGVLRKISSAASFVYSSVSVKSIEQLVDQEKPEIAHLHNIYHQLTPSIIPVLKNHGVKVVLTLHDYKLVCPSYIALKDGGICDQCQGKSFWKPFITNCQNSYMQGLLLSVEAMFHKWKRSYDGVDLFLAPSQFMADIISKRIHPDKIQVLHNGIDTKEYLPNYTDQGYGLYFGRLSKEKGIETLLKAYQKTTRDFPLKIVGTGPMEAELRMEYPAAEFLGYKSGDELNDLIANAAFVVVPSEWYENCSMVVLEAMAFGKPIIGSRIGGIPEQINDGETGFLFEMGNSEELAEKMSILAADSGLRQLLGRSARRKLENEYSLEEHCEHLMQIYQEL